MPQIRKQDWVEASSLNPDDFESFGEDQEKPSAKASPRTDEVVDAHLRARKQDRLEDDLANFDRDVVILSATGIYRGHDGVRQLWSDLADRVPAARFSYGTPITEGDAAMLEWQAQGDHAYVEDGVESYLVRDGRIVLQTIHYTVRRTA